MLVLVDWPAGLLKGVCWFRGCLLARSKLYGDSNGVLHVFSLITLLTVAGVVRGNVGCLGGEEG
ncbi:hypothetical protein E2C01_093693 [Portunus trituberculatus]|uniref:Uncharacterized protein n=1 Tax=Portunus trituberculatus TaxID=210409 RepID=A0A5B7JYU8_PORTR|nr:hypothetical protein [Portunus trituberculatus]